MTLTPCGKREWGTATLGAIVALAILAWLGWWWGFIPVGLLWFSVAWFFRDPVRHVPADLDPNVFVSPADGVISAIETVDSHQATGNRPAVVIRIFLSVLNVHVNRAPFDAVVIEQVYREGKYLDARKPESAKVNESNLIIFERADGSRFGVRQVSGAIARRIVCSLEKGQKVVRGEKIGMIKFGSTTELILPHPETVEVLVKPGDAVRGVRTNLAIGKFAS